MPTEPPWLQEMRTALRMVAATEKSRRLHGLDPTASIDGTLEAVCARLAETEVAADPLLRRIVEALLGAADDLRLSMNQFDFYAQQHLAKQPPDNAKAETNTYHANRCRGALIKARATLAEFDALNPKEKAR